MQANMTHDQLAEMAPYFQVAKNACMSTTDAVFWSLWCLTEIKRLVLTDAALVTAISDNVWHEARGLEFDRTFMGDRYAAWRRHVVLGEPRPA